MTPQTFVFFGQVGSGKGTQVKLLSDFLESKGEKKPLYAGTGEEFRRLMKAGSFTATRVKESYDNGELVPDEITSSIFIKIFIDSLEENDHIIADGYPRTIEQSKIFEKVMEFYQRKKVKIIYIKVSEEEALKRNMLRGRSDDTAEGLKKRFNRWKGPLTRYYCLREKATTLSVNSSWEKMK